jgi:Xaa-Pro aminopeptidase
MTMETMQPTLKNGRNVWDRINMPEAEFQERLKKIQKEMKRERLDLLLLYGNGFDEYGNYTYLGNYVIRLARGAFVVLPREGEPALIFEGASRGIPSIRKTTWIQEIRAGWDASKECVKYLEEKKLVPSKVGLVGVKSLMPCDQFQFLRDSLKGSNVLDVDPLLREMRMVKSSREIDQVRRAARILSRAFGVLSGIGFPEVAEKSIEGTLYREVRIEGAEDFRMMIARPIREQWSFRPAGEGTIPAGETVALFLAVEFERYWAEALRTFVVKENTLVALEREDFNARYGRIIDFLRPGITASQFHKEAVTRLRKEKTGYLLDYGLGQGIGLSPREYPVLSKDDKTPLKEGMCLTFRLLVKEEGLGAMMTGNTLLLTKKGPQILT